MSASRRTSNQSGLIAIAAVVLLAVVAFLLVVYAFRSPQIVGSGEAPGPAPTWSAQRSTTPSSTPTPAGANSPDDQPGADRLLALSNSGAAIRATTGSCGVAVPNVSVLAAPGGAWTPISFGNTSVGEIVNLAYTADTQIDAVVRTLPNCDVTLLTSYTSGEFWALTPERLAEFTYYDADFITLSVFGNTTEPPCPQPLGIVGLAPRAVLQCSDALYVYDPASSSWQLLSLVNAEALAANDEGPALAGISGVADCDGLGIRRYDLQTIPEDGLDISCVPVLQIGAPVALDLDGDNAMIWLDDRILVSADQGVTWNDLA